MSSLRTQKTVRRSVLAAVTSPRRIVAGVISVGLILAGSLLAVSPASAAITGLTVTGPSTSALATTITYNVQLTCDADGCPSPVITIPTPADTIFQSSSLPGSTTNNGSQVVITVEPTPAPSSVTNIQVVYTPNNQFQVNYPTPAAVSLTGISASSTDGSSFSQVGSVDTTITAAYNWSPNKAGEGQPGSNNRVVDWTIGLSSFSGWGLGAYAFVDSFPAGAEVTTSAGWTCDLQPDSTTRCVNLNAGGAGTGGALAPGLTVLYPTAAGFADGDIPSNTVQLYGMKATADNAGNAAAFDPDNPVAGPWFNANSATATSGPFGTGDPSTDPAAIADKVLLGGGAGTILANGGTSTYVLSASVANAAQTTLSIVDDLSAISDHFVAQSVTEHLSAAAAAAGLTARYEAEASDGTVVTLDHVMSENGRVLIGDTGDSASPVALIVLPAATHLASLAVTYFKDDGAGNPVPFGLPGGSRVSLDLAGTVSFADLGDGLVPATLVFNNCLSVTIQPADQTVSDCADEYPVADGLPASVLNMGGTVVAGTTDSNDVVFRLMNWEVVRDITGLTTDLILPTGIFLDPAGVITQSTGRPLASAPTAAVNKLLPDGRQVVTVTYPTIAPDATYLSMDNYFLPSGYSGRDFFLPTTTTVGAYNPPTSDAALMEAFTSAAASTLLGFGGRYSAIIPRAVDAYDVNNNGDVSEALPFGNGSVRVLANGVLAGGVLTADSGVGPFTPSTTIQTGTAGIYQDSVKNVLPNPVSNVRIYNTLPQQGDASGAEFTPAMTGAPVGLPVGTTVEYSTALVPCAAPIDTNATGCSGDYTFAPVSSADFALVKSIRVITPTLASLATLAINIPVLVPLTATDGQVAPNSFTMYGTSAGAPFGPVDTTTGQLVAAVTSNGSIGDFVWDDLDGDGFIDPGEPGLAGVVVSVRDSDGIEVFSTSTTSTGLYLASDLAAGTYSVSFDWSAVTAHVASPTGLLRDNVGAGPVTVTLTIDGAGGTTSRLSTDFGLQPVPAIARLSLVKSADTTTASKVGQVITYSFLVTNTGDLTVEDLAIDDQLAAPAGPALTVVCPVETLAPAAETTCEASYVVTLADLAAGKIVNAATAVGTAAGEEVESNESTVTITADAPLTGALASTGTSASDLLPWGAGLLLLGVLLYLRERRRTA